MTVSAVRLQVSESAARIACVVERRSERVMLTDVKRCRGPDCV